MKAVKAVSNVSSNYGLALESQHADWLARVTALEVLISTHQGRTQSRTPPRMLVASRLTTAVTFRLTVNSCRLLVRLHFNLLLNWQSSKREHRFIRMDTDLAFSISVRYQRKRMTFLRILHCCSTSKIQPMDLVTSFKLTTGTLAETMDQTSILARRSTIDLKTFST